MFLKDAYQKLGKEAKRLGKQQRQSASHRDRRAAIPATVWWGLARRVCHTHNAEARDASRNYACRLYSVAGTCLTLTRRRTKQVQNEFVI